MTPDQVAALAAVISSVRELGTGFTVAVLGGLWLIHKGYLVLGREARASADREVFWRDRADRYLNLAERGAVTSEKLAG